MERELPQEFPAIDPAFLAELGRVAANPRHAAHSAHRLDPHRVLELLTASTAGLTIGVVAAIAPTSGRTEPDPVSSEQIQESPSSDTPIPSITAESTIPQPTHSPEVEVVESTPSEFDPASYEKGAFIGAFKINYAEYDKNAELTSQDVQDCRDGKALSEAKMGACFWQLRTEYFGDAPKAYGESVHRLTAGDGYNVNPYLDNGPVLHTDRLPGEPIVIAMHNITPIEQTVELNDKKYDQSMLGINNFIAKGSMVKIVEPSDIDGKVIERTYERTGFFIVNYDADPSAAADKVYAPKDGVDMRVYNCWIPGNANLRLVYEFTEVSSEFVGGNVAATSETIVGDGLLG